MAYQVQKEDYTTREHSLTNNTILVADSTTIDELGNDLKSAETLEKHRSKEGLQQLGLFLIL